MESASVLHATRSADAIGIVSYGIITVGSVYCQAHYVQTTKIFWNASPCLLRPAFPRTEARTAEVGVFLQRNRAGEEDEVWPGHLRLPHQPRQTPRPLLGMDLQSHRQNRKREAFSAGRPDFQSGLSAKPQAQVALGAPGASISVRAQNFGPPSRTIEDTPPCLKRSIWQHTNRQAQKYVALGCQLSLTNPPHETLPFFWETEWRNQSRITYHGSQLS